MLKNLKNKNQYKQSLIIYLLLELWVNFDHKYCFWANSLELIQIILNLDVSPISVHLSVTGISNRQTDGKLQRGTWLTD